MNQNADENQFSVRDKKPLTRALILVAVTLILDGVGQIIFKDWLHSTGYPTGETVLEVIVQIVVGLSLLLNMVFARYLNSLYCGLSFLGGVAIFLEPETQGFSFRMLIIFHSIYFGICSTILLLDWLKNRKKIPS